MLYFVRLNFLTQAIEVEHRRKLSPTLNIIGPEWYHITMTQNKTHGDRCITPVLTAASMCVNCVESVNDH